MEYFLPLLIIILCLICEGFFSGSEIAVISADKIYMKQLGEKGSEGARLLNKMGERPEWIVGTALIGTNLSVITSTILATLIMRELYGEKGELYTLALMSPLILIFGETIPKRIFQQRANFMAPKVIFPLWFFSRLFYPLIFLMTKFVEVVFFLGRDKLHSNPFVTIEDLRSLLKSSNKGSDLKLEEKEIISRIFDFPKTNVKGIMVPLIDVAALEDTSTVEEAIEMIADKGFSRLPVYHERIDQIIGIINSIGLWHIPIEEKNIAPYVMPAFYVPETKPIDELLPELQRSKDKMAVVVDEYGGSVGIVTLEDVLEEIVGEIYDEYDTTKTLYYQLSPSRYVINARMEIEQVSELLKIPIPPGEYETLGGFLLDRMGRIPKVGEKLIFGNATFRIIKATTRTITEVSVEIAM